MHQSYIYDIRTSADALGTLVNFTKVIPPIWERYFSRIRDYQYTEDLVEDVIRTHGCFPDNYEKWIFTYFHVTTSANGCASFKKHGLLDLKNSYRCADSELRIFLDSKGIEIDIDNCFLRYKQDRRSCTCRCFYCVLCIHYVCNRVRVCSIRPHRSTL